MEEKKKSQVISCTAQIPYDEWDHYVHQKYTTKLVF